MDDAASKSEQQLADACCAFMYAKDHCVLNLGIEPLTVQPGSAVFSMTVRKDMVNSHGTCHGGIIFCLADASFGYACNSRDQHSVASACSIDFIKPAMLHDRLTARAAERSLTGRIGIYDVDIVNQDGDLIAHFRGKSHQLRGTVTNPKP